MHYHQIMQFIYDILFFSDGSVVVNYLANFNSSAQTTTGNTVASAIQNELISNGTGTFLGPYRLKGDKKTAIKYTGKLLLGPITVEFADPLFKL